MTFILY